MCNLIPDICSCLLIQQPFKSKNNIIVITTTYLFDEKYIKRSEEQLKKYIFTLLSYDTCVCVPFGVGISVEYIPLSAYSPNMIKIWKNDTFNN